MIRIILTAIAVLLFGIVHGTVVAYAALGETPEKSGDVYFEPKACLRVAIDKECTDDLSNLAAQHYDSQQFDKAVMRYSQLISIGDDAQVRTNRGIAYARMREYERAREDFMRTHELAPTRDDPWGNLAQLEWRRGRFKQALGYVSRAIAVRRDRDYLYLKAELLWRLGKKRLATIEKRAADRMRHPSVLPNFVVEVETPK